jgi:hypothetical protein
MTVSSVFHLTTVTIGPRDTAPLVKDFLVIASTQVRAVQRFRMYWPKERLLDIKPASTVLRAIAMHSRKELDGRPLAIHVPPPPPSPPLLRQVYP